MKKTALALALTLLGTSAQAHDTWLVPQPATERGERVLALGTGDHFPLQEGGPPVERIARMACRAPSDKLPPWPLRWQGERRDALLLRTTRAVPAALLLDCHAQTLPTDIELDAKLVEAYFAEARPGAAVRERWARQKAAGLPWREVYVKHARALHGAGPHEVPPGAKLLAGATRSDDGVTMPLDLAVELPGWPLRSSDSVVVQLLSDGKPLPNHALELRHERGGPVGVWQRTDEQGRLTLRLPLAGRWLLRGVELRAAADGSEGWEGRFISLHLDVQ